MAKVSESIFSGKTHVIPMAEVSYIHAHAGKSELTCVVMKSTTINPTNGEYNNAPYLEADEAASFKRAWCDYRSELEAETLMDLAPKGKD